MHKNNFLKGKVQKLKVVFKFNFIIYKTYMLVKFTLTIINLR